jgi:hypothetical protein
VGSEARTVRTSILRLGLGALGLSVAFGAAGLRADAEGVTRIQQSDGTVQVYRDSHLRLVGKTLWITSADHRGRLQVVNGACSFAGELQRCLTDAVTLHQHGRTHDIAIDHGTVYLNLSDAAQVLPHSGQQLAPRNVLVAFRTAHGTYVSVRGALDEAPQ